MFEVHSGLNVLVDTLPRSRASQEADWPTVKDDDPQDGTDSLPEALKLLVVSNVGGRRSSARVVAVRRFETAPGKQAQVDWGHLGTLEIAGLEQKLHGFTFTLGYSRRMVAEAALDQKLGTLLRLHEAAFQQIGGVPEEILYDRMKTVWLGTDERGEIVWHPVFKDFAHYWGFTPRL